MAMASGRTLTLLCALFGSGCAHSANVERVYNGTRVDEGYVEAPAYAAFLRTSMASAAHPRDSEEPLDRAAQFRAAAIWAAGHDALQLRVALRAALARIGPLGRKEAAREAEQLAGLGAIGSAWSLAAAAVDASDEPLSADLSLAARLAVDEAIARGDRARVTLRATRGRVEWGEVAARAFLAGQRDLAAFVARVQAVADPRAFGARIVLSAAGGSDAMALKETPPVEAPPMSAAEWVVYGQALRRAVGSDAARSRLKPARHGIMLSSDELVVRGAVDLARRGVIEIESLPHEGAIELAVIDDGSLEGQAGPATSNLEGLDPRHRYLELARDAPLDPRTRELGDRLDETGPKDRVVMAARSLVHLATGVNATAGEARALFEMDPGDPLLASVALRLAERTGDVETGNMARALLALASPGAPTLP
jgi:hypothetical protein